MGYWTVDIPADADSRIKTYNSRLGTLGNLEGGFCQGWSPSATKTLESAWSACSSNKFYQPGKVDGTCTAYFVPTETNSIFRKFEFWSLKEYDSVWEVSLATKIEPFSYTKQITAMAQCSSMMQQTFGTKYKTIAATTWDYIVKVAVEDCTVDHTGTTPVLSDEIILAICTQIAPKVDQERRDIYCATQNYRSKCSAINMKSISDEISTLLTADQTAKFRRYLDDANKAQTEVESSADNIQYWYRAACKSHYKINKDTLDDISCSNYVFADTVKDLDDAGLGFSHKVMTVTNMANSLPIPDSIPKATAVIFFGPPTNSEKDASVVRTELTSAGYFTTSMIDSRCSTSFAHLVENVNYMILDSAQTYDDFYIMKLQVNRSWQQVTAPGDYVAVIAAIQTFNNKPSAQRSAVSASTGYITVRMDMTTQIPSRTFKVRLQADKLSDKSNTNLVD